MFICILRYKDLLQINWYIVVFNKKLVFGTLCSLHLHEGARNFILPIVFQQYMLLSVTPTAMFALQKHIFAALCVKQI